MPVLVDPLREYPHVPYSVKRWCHMAVDGAFEELHVFAAQLGIPRHRFQGDHYDLPPGVSERAAWSPAPRRGIGLALADALAAAGADVVGVSRTLEPAGSEVQRRVEAHGRAFTGLRADLGDRADVLALAAR